MRNFRGSVSCQQHVQPCRPASRSSLTACPKAAPVVAAGARGAAACGGCASVTVGGAVDAHLGSGIRLRRARVRCMFRDQSVASRASVRDAIETFARCLQGEAACLESTTSAGSAHTSHAHHALTAPSASQLTAIARPIVEQHAPHAFDAGAGRRAPNAASGAGHAAAVDAHIEETARGHCVSYE